MFATKDIRIAVFLNTKGYYYQVKVSKDDHLADFIFPNEIPDYIFREWMSGNALAPVTLTINAYRHISRAITLAKREYWKDLENEGRAVNSTELSTLLEREGLSSIR